MITVRDLWFSYDQKRDILKGINLSIGKGSVVSLLGPNGSGKTTLLKCVNAILNPRKGSVYLDGKDVSRMKRSEIARTVSYVPQEHRTTFPYSVLDLVLQGISPHVGLFSTPKREDIEKAYEVLAFLGIGDLAERPYTELSGGERKLCLIARALMTSSEILLMDEPTAHLDLKHQGEVLRMIKTLTGERGLTVVMTLHDPNISAMTADRIVLLKGGEVMAEGDVVSVMTEENVKSVFDCEISSFNVEGTRLMYPRM